MECPMNADHLALTIPSVTVAAVVFYSADHLALTIPSLEIFGIKEESVSYF
jgi:hypothetical protein